jgi:hypothetical protein
VPPLTGDAIFVVCETYGVNVDGGAPAAAVLSAVAADHLTPRSVDRRASIRNREMHGPRGMCKLRAGRELEFLLCRAGTQQQARLTLVSFCLQRSSVRMYVNFTVGAGTAPSILSPFSTLLCPLFPSKLLAKQTPLPMLLLPFNRFSHSEASSLKRKFSEVATNITASIA